MSDAERQSRMPTTSRVDGATTPVALIPNLVPPRRAGLHTLRTLRDQRRVVKTQSQRFDDPETPAPETAPAATRTED